MIKKNNNKKINKIVKKAINNTQVPKEILIPGLLLPRKKCLFQVDKYGDYFENEIRDLNKGRWSLKEHIQFLKAIDKFGVNWKKIKRSIKTRTSNQIRSHSQKFYKKLKQCKDGDLGIDFTLDSIHNLKDIIKHIKSVNKDLDIVNVLLYMSEKYYTNKPSKKSEQIENEVNINNNFNEAKNINNIEINNSINFFEMKEKNNLINEEIIDNQQISTNNLIINNFLIANMNFINNNLDVLINNYLSDAIITNIICNMHFNNHINMLNLINSNYHMIPKDLSNDRIFPYHPLVNNNNSYSNISINNIEN